MFVPYVYFKLPATFFLDFYLFVLCLFTGARKDLCDLWQTCKKLPLLFGFLKTELPFCCVWFFSICQNFLCNNSFSVLQKSDAKLVYFDNFIYSISKSIIRLQILNHTGWAKILNNSMAAKEMTEMCLSTCSSSGRTICTNLKR